MSNEGKYKVKATRYCIHGNPELFWDKLCTPQQYGVCKKKIKCKIYLNLKHEYLKVKAREMFMMCEAFTFDIEIKKKIIK